MNVRHFRKTLHDRFFRTRSLRLDHCANTERKGKYRAARVANYRVRCSFSWKLLFVDDHSTDGTRAKIRTLEGSHPIRLIEQNAADVGLAGAIMSGARAAQGEILIVMDADLSHPPDRIKDLLAPVICRYRRPGGWEPLYQRWIDAGMATMAPNRVASRCGARLSANWSARFDVRLFCHWAFPVAGVGAANQRFQNCFRDDRAWQWHIACTRNPHRFSRTRTREIENVARHRTAIFFPLVARDVPAPFPRRRSPTKNVESWLAHRRPYNTRPQESSADASRQTRLELSPNTTTITSLPGRVPLAIRHLPAASV